MCGICGVVGRDAPGTVEEMAACLSHRGPENTGVHADASVTLANQRLRVIDVDGGDQPIYNEDGDVVVVYNGEIFNYRSLRGTLDDAGHTFTTNSDTEVLVHGYEEWGPGLFERLNGMFAVALWDADTERAYLARDRAGVKPLFYAAVDGGLVFGSEPKAVLRSGLVEAAVDERALQYFLQLRYSPSHTSLFDGVEKLEPGTYLEVARADGEWTTSQRRYWSVADVTGEPPADPARAVREALRRAVRRQLVSEVPVGFYLSGGLDTSSVVAMADEFTDEPVRTFCMGFADQEWDERADARAVADHFGTDHHEIVVENDFMRDFPRMIWHADEPKRNLYPYYVAEAMSDHVTVALGGLGADELFGGYVYRYNRLHELEQLAAVEPASVRESVAETASTVASYHLERGDLDGDGFLEDLDVLRHLDDPATLYVLLNSTDVLGDAEFYRTRVFGPALDDEFAPADWIRDDTSPEDASLRNKALYWDFTVKLPNDFLLVEDRMSMAHSLESRVPFLDNELVDLAFRLPLSEKFYAPGEDPSAGKAVLRKAMRPVLPDAVFEKEKQGFTMPTFPFARDELLDHARSILDSPRVVADGLVEGGYVRDLLAREPSRDLTPHYKLLWKLVGLEIWYQMYVVGDVDGPDAVETYYT
jgi:asparagine synthase (glutamine-hydrolysing)